VVVREKSQYRIFKWNSGDKYLSVGFVGVRFTDQQAQGISWSDTQGFKVYSSDSKQYDELELVLFANDDGYIYKMESGTSFDGDDIPCSFRTPDLPVTDPRVRKTWYKLTTYLKSDLNLSLTLQVVLDNGKSRVVQPKPITIQNVGSSTVYFWDSPTTIWDSFVWSEAVDTITSNNLIGSSKTIAFNFSETSSTSAFTLETLLLEFRQNDRK
jgi:hypothetical protein